LLRPLPNFLRVLLSPFPGMMRVDADGGPAARMAVGKPDAVRAFGKVCSGQKQSVDALLTRTLQNLFPVLRK